VTLDLGLPPDADGTSEGFATLAEILALKPDTKVIVASGHGARESALKAISLGAYDFVNVVEAPDNLTIARVSAELSARGSVRITTLPAIPIDEFIDGLRSGQSGA
jgi:DNA-binding NtrC family response regulator